MRGMKIEAEVEREERTGVAAAEVVLQVLTAFVGAEPMVMLKTLAQRAEMHPAKVHRYLVSLRRHGFVRQDAQTGLYQLAEGALNLGLAALEETDLTTVAKPVMTSLREETKLSSMLATWELSGPIVALQEIQPAPLMLTTRVGSPLPILATATGLIFCAWLPRASVERALGNIGDAPSWASSGSDGPSWGHGHRNATSSAAFDAALEQIRRDGIASSSGQMNAHIHGLSAPVFDGTGHIVAVLSVLGSAGLVDLRLNGATGTALKSHALQLSQELGWSIEEASGSHFPASMEADLFRQPGKP